MTLSVIEMNLKKNSAAFLCTIKRTRLVLCEGHSMQNLKVLPLVFYWIRCVGGFVVSAGHARRRRGILGFRPTASSQRGSEI